MMRSMVLCLTMACHCGEKKVGSSSTELEAGLLKCIQETKASMWSVTYVKNVILLGAHLIYMQSS